MSVQAIAWVWDHSAHKSGNLLVLLAIANHAHADGTGAHPHLETLAGECRMSVRQVSRIVGELADSGELVVERQRRGNLYALPMSTVNLTVDTSGESQGTPAATLNETSTSSPYIAEPSDEPSIEPKTLAPLAQVEVLSTHAARRDLVFETLARIDGYDYATAGPRPNRREAGRIGDAASAVREAGVNDPALLASYIAHWPDVFPNLTCTAQAVSSHIGRLRMAANGTVARASNTGGDSIRRRAMQGLQA